MIKIESLTYFYPQAEEPALRGLSLFINSGDFVLMTGPSGAGKSTLLRCLNGLVPHFSGCAISGTIEIEGIDVIASTPRALSQKVGFVFQDPESQTVLDNVEDEVAFVLENAGTPAEEMHYRVEETLELLGLTPLRNRLLVSLSGGERQKAAIAAAIVLNPPILVLDEPTSQLDWQSAEDLMGALKQLNQELGTTIIIVEQRIERVISYTNRTLIMESGQISSSSSQPGPTLSVAGLPMDRSKNQEIRRNGRQNPAIEMLKELAVLDNSYGTLKRLQPAKGHQISEPLLSIKNLTCGYGQDAILNDVSLHVSKGEAVALVGRNGSGKTTLLKSVVGLLKPIKGEIKVDGRSTLGRSVADICQEVAYLPQIPDDLLFADSVEQEFEVTLANHGMDLQANSEMIEILLSSLELSNVRKNYPRDLSVGQRQRVAMGSVLVTGPKLILLDEPTRGLDMSLKQSLITLFSRWLEDGHGLLLVTHDLDLAENLSNRILTLEKGQIVEEETADWIDQQERANIS